MSERKLLLYGIIALAVLAGFWAYLVKTRESIQKLSRCPGQEPYVKNLVWHGIEYHDWRKEPEISYYMGCTGNLYWVRWYEPSSRYVYHIGFSKTDTVIFMPFEDGIMTVMDANSQQAKTWYDKLAKVQSAYGAQNK